MKYSFAHVDQDTFEKCTKGVGKLIAGFAERQ